MQHARSAVQKHAVQGDTDLYRVKFTICIPQTFDCRHFLSIHGYQWRHTCCTTAMASPRSQGRHKHRTKEKKKDLDHLHQALTQSTKRRTLEACPPQSRLKNTFGQIWALLSSATDTGLMPLLVEYILVECMKWKDTLLSVGTDHSGRPWQYRLHRLPHHTPPSFPSVPLKKGHNIRKRTRWAEFNRASKVDRQYTSLGGTGRLCFAVQCNAHRSRSHLVIETTYIWHHTMHGAVHPGIGYI